MKTFLESGQQIRFVVLKATGNGGYVFVSGRDEWELGHIPENPFVDVPVELTGKNDLLPTMMPAAWRRQVLENSRA